jgi:pimeloyl-ACP methyl ester carboxylesterase
VTVVQGEEQRRSFRSLDGLELHSTVTTTGGRSGRGVVLVHGGGVTRDEGGFFTRLAAGLAAAGATALRFDFRGHGQSAGRQEDLTLAAVRNDIRAAVAFLREQLGESAPVSLLGASFSGGNCAAFAAERPQDVERLVLINPLLNYKKRFIDEKPYWHADRLDPAEATELTENGFLPHSPTFKLGRPLLNEVFHFDHPAVLAAVKAPTLFLHGSEDTFIPVQSSRDAVALVGAPAVLVEVEGAQHGIAAHDDPGYVDPRSQRWQAQAIELIAAWLATGELNATRL